MRVDFEKATSGPERLVANAEVVFEEGPLAGLKLAGFSLWRSAEGDVYVTFPSRPYGTGSARRFYDFLRPVNGNGQDVRRVKDWLREQYLAEQALEAR